jgi:hypothetical protein
VFSHSWLILHQITEKQIRLLLVASSSFSCLTGCL